MRFKVVTLGVLLVGLSAGSSALTLGRARGAAWIGQPLQLVVPLQLDPGQDASAICTEADVFHAENRLESDKVSVVIEPTAQADSVNIRITSSTLIDEPVVTVYLRAGCAQKTTRRFVLLADYPTEMPTPPSTTQGPLTTASAPAALVRENVAPVPSLPKAASPAPAKTRTAKIKSDLPTKAGGRERAKLTLDPLENLTERIKTLETATSAAPLEEMVRESRRIQQLQGDIQVLLSQAAKNEASLLAMRERLEKAESERISMAWMGVFAGLIAACITGLGILWHRRSEPGNWQRSLPNDGALPDTAHAAGLPVAKPAPPAAPQAAPPATGGIHSTIQMSLDERDDLDVDVNLMDMDSNFSSLIMPNGHHADKKHSTDKPVGTSESDLGPRSFLDDALNDVRQQAEFFEQLGKVDQAIDVLERQIRINNKDAPWLYLDLLHIANTHNLKTDFRQFRSEFEALFNVKVPEFALFRDEGRGLESYPSLLQHIGKLWPTQGVLDVIEACAIRVPFEKNAEPFELAAFKELILLHGIVKSHLDEATSSEMRDATDSEHIDLAM